MKIGRRIGSLLKENSRAAKAFEVKVEAPPGGGYHVSWTRCTDGQSWAELSEGAYLLRTNLAGWSPSQLWKSYMQLAQVEKAFHIAKDDLAIRPIFHQTAERTRAHVLVCFLAYVLWRTLEKLCEASGLGTSARTVLDQMRRLTTVDVILPTQDGRELRLRCVSEPDEGLKTLLQHLGLTVPRRLEVPLGLEATM